MVVWKQLDPSVDRRARASNDWSSVVATVVEHGQINMCVLEGYIGAAWRNGDEKSCCIFSEEGECVRK